MIRRWLVAGGIGAIAVLAGILRLYRIGAQELWLDEAYSVYLVTRPDPTRPPEYLQSVNALYYLLLKGWMAIAGQSEAAVRLPSAFFGTLFVLGVIWAGREFVSLPAGLWAGFFAAIAPIHIYYSQEARAYAVLTLAILVAQTLAWRAVRSGTWTSWMLVGLSAWLAITCHALAVLALVPAFCLAFFPRLSPAVRGPLQPIAAMLLCAALLLPFIPWEFGFSSHSRTGTDWIKASWEALPPWSAIPKSLEVFGLGPRIGLPDLRLKQYAAMTVSPDLRSMALVSLGLLLLVTLLPHGDSGLNLSSTGKRKAWLWTLCLGPLSALWAISFYRPIYVAGRYDMIAFPAFALLVGLGFAKLSRVGKAGPALAAAAAVLLVLPIGIKLQRYYQAPSSPVYRSTANVLDQSVRNGDLVVISGGWGLPTLYYLNQLGYRWIGDACVNEMTGRRFACRLFPRAMERHPAIAYGDLVSAEGVRDDLRNYLEGVSGKSPMVWVVARGIGYRASGELIVSPEDNLLEDELKRNGFARLSVTVSQVLDNIRAFRREAQ